MRTSVGMFLLSTGRSDRTRVRRSSSADSVQQNTSLIERSVSCCVRGGSLKNTPLTVRLNTTAVFILVCFGQGRDSSVGTATRYGLDGPGIESLWGRDFPHPSRPALEPTQSPVQWVPGLSRG